MIIKAEGESNAGLVRDHNEDCFGFEAEAEIYLVSDGVGGHARGEVASDIVRETILHCYSESQDLVSAINTAHLAVKQKAVELENARGMSATVVAIAFKQQAYQVAWVGDSRAYLFKPEKQQLQQLSTDHSLVQILFDKGVISHQEMRSHPEKNIITQAVGLDAVEHVEVGAELGVCENNDIFLLCSDGLTDMLDDNSIGEILSREIGLQEKVRYLIGAALKAGGKDNVTVFLLEASGVDNSKNTDEPLAVEENSNLKPMSVGKIISVLAIVLVMIGAFFYL